MMTGASDLHTAHSNWQRGGAARRPTHIRCVDQALWLRARRLRGDSSPVDQPDPPHTAFEERAFRAAQRLQDECENSLQLKFLWRIPTATVSCRTA